jgi:hypothetical protein
MRACVLAMVLFAGPGLAEPAKVVIAPAGECAGEERELRHPLLPKSARQSDSERALQPAALAHLSPANVAATAASAGAPLPLPPAFSGPGACDDPGSGCVSEKLLEDPDPGTGCGFPGSVCP